MFEHAMSSMSSYCECLLASHWCPFWGDLINLIMWSLTAGSESLYHTLRDSSPFTASCLPWGEERPLIGNVLSKHMVSRNHKLNHLDLWVKMSQNSGYSGKVTGRPIRSFYWQLPLLAKPQEALACVSWRVVYNVALKSEVPKCWKGLLWCSYLNCSYITKKNMWVRNWYKKLINPKNNWRMMVWPYCPHFPYWKACKIILRFSFFLLVSLYPNLSPSKSLSFILVSCTWTPPSNSRFSIIGSLNMTV